MGKWFFINEELNVWQKINNIETLVNQLLNDKTTNEEDIILLKSEIENIKNEINSVNNKINNNNNIIKEEIERLWEIKTLTKVITFDEWVDNTYTIENEIFSTNNHIIVSPSPDNGNDIINNVKAFGLYGIQAQEITQEGRITLKATIDTPQLTLYVQFLVMIPASINFNVSGGV